MTTERVELAGGRAIMYRGDCLEILHDVCAADALITDPPYSSGGQFRGDRAKDTRVKYASTGSGNRETCHDFAGDTRDQRGFMYWSALWLGAALRACAPGSPCVVFTDWRQLPSVTDAIQAGGWVWRGIVPWVKPAPRPSMGRFAQACEFVAWGSAGAMPIERGVGCLPGFYRHAAPTEREHVTQKPDRLMDDLVEICAPGGVILDPFAGSGTTGAAALRTGRGFVGIEIDPVHFEIACRRIDDSQRQGDLFGPGEGELQGVAEA